MMTDLEGALALSNIVTVRIHDKDARLRDIYRSLRINQTQLNNWCRETFDQHASRLIDTLRYGCRISIPNARLFSGFLEVDLAAFNKRVNTTGYPSGDLVIKDNTALVCTNGDILVLASMPGFNDYHELWVVGGRSICTNKEGMFSSRLYKNSRVEDNAIVDSILAMASYRAREVSRDKSARFQ